ncbi:Hypothetical protein NTJ_13802 [Nesidiocoris tenuis]|uniref:Uncharacterized protein n=1 Tax=Nesidiocoris tenuis TaxID=355587 RepID=A0ABN7B9B8_9HEMI|nr:Hypothetical protein NTJ_13802 [Nesidiocoris tenuis]
MVNRCPAPLVAAIATPLLRLLVLIAGSLLVGHRIYQEAKKDRAPNPWVSRVVAPISEFNPETPDLHGLEPLSEYDHLDFFMRVLKRGMNYFEYCDLSLKTPDPCENLKDSKKGREAKAGLYCPPDGESCILMQTALPSGNLEKFIDDWLNNRMNDWEFCMSRSLNFYCGAIFSNFSRSSKRGLISPKRSDNQEYSLTIHTVYVSVRNNMYPPLPRQKTTKDPYFTDPTTRFTRPTTQPPKRKLLCQYPLTVRPPRGIRFRNQKARNFIYRNMDYWQYNRKYWFMLALLEFTFVGTFYEMAVVSWFVWMYLNATADFHKWTKFQFVVIGMNYTFAAMFAMLLAQDIPRDSITIWIAVFSVSMIISTVNSSLFVHWVNKKQPDFSTREKNQEAIERNSID